MKKQVKFAENQMVHRLHHNEALPRSFGMIQSEMVAASNHAGVNFSNGWKINSPHAAGNNPKLLHLMDIQIPKATTAAPFLKHAALTPAQREYLYTIAASYSPAHVRSLITQHYMNVLRKSIPSGQSPDREGLFVTAVTSAENEKNEKNQPKAQSEKLSRSKHKGKTNTNARYFGKSFQPNRKSRSVSASALKHKKMKKRASASQLNRKSPKGSRTRLKKEEEEDEEEEEEEGPDESLSECLSSLSFEEWDDDNFSDL